MKTYLFLLSLIMTVGCARNLNSNDYVSSLTSGVVLQGVVVSTREVTVSGADRLAGYNTGLLVGSVGGGIIGAGVGAGTGTALAALGGAVIGGTAGALVEQQLTDAEGIEYLVKIDRKYVDYAPKEPLKRTKTAPITTGGDVVSVIQGKNEIFTTGQRVYIIYTGDRPRVIARN